MIDREEQPEPQEFGLRPTKPTTVSYSNELTERRGRHSGQIDSKPCSMCGVQITLDSRRMKANGGRVLIACRACRAVVDVRHADLYRLPVDEPTGSAPARRRRARWGKKPAATPASAPGTPERPRPSGPPGAPRAGRVLKRLDRGATAGSQMPEANIDLEARLMAGAPLGADGPATLPGPDATAEAGQPPALAANAQGPSGLPAGWAGTAPRWVPAAQPGAGARGAPGGRRPPTRSAGPNASLDGPRPPEPSEDQVGRVDLRPPPAGSPGTGTLGPLEPAPRRASEPRPFGGVRPPVWGDTGSRGAPRPGR